MTFQDLLDTQGPAVGLPEIAGDRCVHARIETAECSRCVEACPRDAWVLDDEQLGFDESACDGCGLCVPACPSRAISNAVGVTTVWFRERRVALIGCDRTGYTGDGIVPCVHAIGLDHLLEIYREGVRTVLYTHADCAGCPRDCQGSSFPRLLKNMQALLHSRGMAGLVAKAYSPGEWLARREVLLTRGMVNAGAGTSRRSFLRDAAGKALEQGMRAVKVPLPEAEERRLSIEQWLKAVDHDAMFPAVPTIDTGRCTACGACIRVCPEGALRMVQEPPAYIVEPGHCTACGLCEPVCGQQAIHIVEWSQGRSNIIPLDPRRCRSCGVEFFQMGDQEADAQDRCPICRRTDWHSNLYQVLEG